MIIKRLILGPVATNCYIFLDEDSKEAAVIDPSADHESILNVIKENGCKLKKIILTHGHYDHIGGLSGLLEAEPEAKVYAHEKSTEVLGEPRVNLSGELGRKEETFKADIAVKDGDVIPFGKDEFKVIYTPGHTIDGICLVIDGKVFCGDTIFRFSVGRTDFPTGDMSREIQSIKTKLMPLDDSVRLYPGHGEPTTVGDERRGNPYLR